MRNALSLQRRHILALAAATGSGLSPLPVQAQAYPNRAVKVLVGAVAGGPADFIARIFAETVTAHGLGGSMVIENRPGASSMLATEAAAKAPADGYTLLSSGPGPVAVQPHLMAKLPYDPAALVPVAMPGAGAFVLVVHPSVPVNNVKELLALAKAKPGELTYGSGGNGSSGHLCTELFTGMGGGKMTHVPYKGDGQAMVDLLGGQIHVMFTAPNVAMTHVKAGKLKLLAVTTPTRVPTMADVPTVAESGLPGFESMGWIVIFAPPGTPKPVLDALSAAWAKGRRTPTVQGKLIELGMATPEPLASADGPTIAAFVRSESARLGKVIRDTGIKADQ